MGLETDSRDFSIYLNSLKQRLQYKQKMPQRNLFSLPVVLMFHYMALTRTGNYQIHEFDWLKWILTAVLISPSRPASRPEGDMGGLEHRNIAKKFNEHRITARKVHETPSSQQLFLAA